MLTFKHSNVEQHYGILDNRMLVKQPASYSRHLLQNQQMDAITEYILFVLY